MVWRQQATSGTVAGPNKSENEPGYSVVWRVDFGVMEWGVMRAAFPLGCCVVGVAES